MIKYIRLPNDLLVPIASYVKAWRNLKAAPDKTKSVAGFFYFQERIDRILGAISYAANDRINIRGGIVVASRVPPASRLYRRIAASGIACNCRWCGSALPSWQPVQNRFCDPDCSRSYSS